MTLVISGLPHQDIPKMEEKIYKIISLLQIKTVLRKQKQLHVIFKKRILDGNWGTYMIPLQGPINKGREDKIQVIYIKKDLSKEYLTKTLIHEFTHLKQILTGKFAWVQRRRSGPIHAHWNKKNLGTEEKLGLTYEDLPWEKEAVAMEERLWNRV